MTLKLRLVPRPTIIARVTPRLCGATVEAGAGIDVELSGGVYTISIDSEDTDFISSVVDDDNVVATITDGVLTVGLSDTLTFTGKNIIGGVLISPPAATAGLTINQFIAGNIGTKSANYYYNEALISDNITQTSGTTYGLNINMHIDTSATGAKAAIRGEVDVLNSGVSTGNDIVGIVGTVFANKPNGGSGGSPAGRMYGLASAPILVSGATDYDVLTGLEANVIVTTGASVDKRWGISLNSGGDVQGAISDTAISIWGSTGAKWQTGILFYDPGFAPLSSTATVIHLEGTHTAGSFINAINYTFSDNIFSFDKFAVSGTGTVTTYGNISVTDTKNITFTGLGEGFAISKKTGIAADANMTTCSCSAGMVYFRDLTAGGYALVAYDGGSTPVIISGTANFSVTDPGSAGSKWFIKPFPNGGNLTNRYAVSHDVEYIIMGGLAS